MSEQEALTQAKPCPFCECVVLDFQYHGSGYQVWCESCNARGPKAETTLKAVQEWNHVAHIMAELRRLWASDWKR